MAVKKDYGLLFEEKFHNSKTHRMHISNWWEKSYKVNTV